MKFKITMINEDIIISGDIRINSIEKFIQKKLQDLYILIKPDNIAIRTCNILKVKEIKE